LKDQLAREGLRAAIASGRTIPPTAAFRRILKCPGAPGSGPVLRRRALFRPWDTWICTRNWVPDVDDGVRTVADGVASCARSATPGSRPWVATPHMRPGMFDNDKKRLEQAFAAMCGQLPAGLPEVHLASEHWFDDIVFERMLTGQGLPYPGGRALLVEFNPQAFPLRVAERLMDLRRKGITPVIAHPERLPARLEGSRLPRADARCGRVPPARHLLARREVRRCAEARGREAPRRRRVRGRVLRCASAR